MAKNNKIKVIIEADSKRYEMAVDKVSGKTKRLGKDVKKSAGNMRHFAGTLKLAGAVMAGMGVAKLSQQILESGLALERVARTLKFATGSAEQGAQAFDYLRKMSNELGLDLLSTADSFAKFSAAAKGSDLEHEVGNIFTGVSTAVSALGLSADAARGVFRALEQMVSKGNVQAEELRGQLGERLPGALKLSATALGVTTQQLNKMLDKGEVLAVDLLPKLGQLLRSEFGDASIESSKQGQAAINRLSTAWDVFTAKLYDSDAFSYAGNKLASSLNFISGEETFVNIKQTTKALDELHAQIKRINATDYEIKNTKVGHARRNFSQVKEKNRITQSLKQQILELEQDLQLARQASSDIDELDTAAQTINDKIAKAEEKLLNTGAKKSANPHGRANNPYDKIQRQIESYKKALNAINVSIDKADNLDTKKFIESGIAGFSKEEAARIIAITHISKANEKIKTDFIYTEIEKRRATLNADFEKRTALAKQHHAIDSQEYQNYLSNYRLAHQQLADDEVHINREAQKKKINDARKAQEVILREARDAQSGITRATKDYYDSATDSATQYENLTTNALNGIEDAFIKLFTTGKLEAKDFFNSVAADIARMYTQQKITGPLAKALGLNVSSGGASSGGFLDGLLGNFFGGSSTSSGGSIVPSGGVNGGYWDMAHTGGIVGHTSIKSNYLPASVFNNAPRYYGGGVAGLASDEVPTILQRGEGVFTAKQMQALAPVSPVNTTNNSTKGDTVINVTYAPNLSSLDPSTAAQVIAQNAPLVVGIVRQAFNRSGQEVSL